MGEDRKHCTRVVGEKERERGWGLIYEQLLFTAERDFDRTNSEPVLLIGHEESSHPFAKARSPSTE